MLAKCIRFAPRFLFAASVLTLASTLSQGVSGQQAHSTEESPFSLAQAEQPRTLPPVEVVPPAELPPVEVFSVEGAEGAAEYDRPFTFPSLSQQEFGGSPLDFGGLNSANRSARSIFEQPNLGTIVNQGLIREKSATDMFRALEQEVGVLMQATGRGQASPFLRGVTGQQVLILMDGIRVNNTTFRSGPNQYFNTIDPGQVERIEVIRGAGSVLWGGDAIGGVINVVNHLCP
jgi:outer membrane receptor protein involved in Fe transport